jgi:hypothetical protein
VIIQTPESGTDIVDVLEDFFERTIVVAQVPYVEEVP